MTKELIGILRSSEDYVSGQNIADSLHISRTAVWKAVEKARKEGFDIEAVRKKGYRLGKGGLAYGKTAIETALSTRWIGQNGNFVFFPSAGSTNDELRKRAEAGAEEGMLAVADEQTAGRGRLGRTWSSPAGNDIYMSVLLRPAFGPESGSMATLPMAMAVAGGIRAVTGLDTKIKWPNDIICGDKKLSGILTEMAAEPGLIRYIIIGIGINVNNDSFPEELKYASSLLLMTGKKTDRSLLISRVMEEFEAAYDSFKKDGNLAFMREAYNSLCVNAGTVVKVADTGGEYEALAEGIDEWGRLIVRKADGRKEALFAGEVSVRGVYGYV